MSVQIVPQALPQLVYGFRYSVDSWSFDNHITLTIMFMNKNNVMSAISKITLAGDDYANWGNDDSYIINYIVNHFGITLKPPDPIVESVE
jgi:hypothetical protein